MSWSDVKQWKAASITTAATGIGELATKASSAANEVPSEVPSWDGVAANAATISMVLLRDEAQDINDLLKDFQTALDDLATGVGRVEKECSSIVTDLAAWPKMTIDGQGGLSFTCEEEEKAEYEAAMNGFIARIEAVLADAAAVDTAFIGDLASVSGASEGDKAHRGGPYASADLPPEIAAMFNHGGRPVNEMSIEEQYKWWSGLSQSEKLELIRLAPERLSQIPGIDPWAMDAANRSVLAADVEALDEIDKLRQQALKESLQSGAEGYPDYGMYLDHDQTRFWNANHGKLEELQKQVDEYTPAVDPVTKQPLPVYLLDYDPGTGTGIGEYHPQAAIAIGHVDSASNVGVLVPGMTTNLEKSTGMELDNANSLLQGAGGDTAMVAFLNYDAPPGILEATQGERAHRGGADLARFVENIHDSRAARGTEHPQHGTIESNPRISIMGHSYGSTVTGVALGEVRDGVVDAAILYGSPGIFKGSWADFEGGKIPELYVMRNEDDIINKLHNNHGIDTKATEPGDLRWGTILGRDPMDTEEFMVLPADMTDNNTIHTTDVDGHVNYVRNDNTNQHIHRVINGSAQEWYNDYSAGYAGNVHSIGYYDVRTGGTYQIEVPDNHIYNTDVDTLNAALADGAILFDEHGNQINSYPGPK